MTHSATTLRSAALVLLGAVAGAWLAGGAAAPAPPPLPRAHAGGVSVAHQGRFVTTDEDGGTLNVWEDLDGDRWRLTRLRAGPPGSSLEVERWEGPRGR